MKRLPRRVLAGLLWATLLAATCPTASAADSDPFAPAEHCLAYRTTKGMLFLMDVAVLGKSCVPEAAVQVDVASGTARVTVAVPVASFDSGNGRRDAHVAALLGAPAHPELRYTSEPVPLARLLAALKGAPLTLPGTFRVAGQDTAVAFPLRLTATEAGPVVTGSLATRFDTLGIAVPRVGPGGMIAAPQEAVTLLVHLRWSRVQGAAALGEPTLTAKAE